MSLVQVVALGGVGEIGKNCTIVEQDDDIVVIDCGLSFPNEEMLGVDIVVPDFTYLVENKDRIRGVFITHAHEDHVGGWPYLLSQINVPVFASELTTALISNKLEEKIPTKQLDIRTFKPGDVLQAGSMTVETIRITHSIPETCCMAVSTKHGYIFFTADFKFDFTPVDHKLTDITRIGEIGKLGVLCLLSDSTNVDRPGWGPSETLVKDGLKKVLATAPGRVLLTTFASNIHRMQQLCDAAEEMGRKLAVVGRRMEQNLDICQRLGYLKIPKGLKINLDEMSKYPDNEIAVLTTGSQGEPMSALVQMSKGTYGRLQIRQGDTLIYSARPIPGNEGAIWRTINRLFRQGCNVIYQGMNIHVSGHAYQEELKMMVNLTRPFYIAPVHGEPRHQHLYNEIAQGMGYPEHRIFTMEAGIPLVFTETEAHLGQQIPCGRVLVDGSGTPGVTDEVLRDRYNVANDGLVVITIAMDPEHGELVGDPIMQAKGFHGPEGLLDQAFAALEDALGNMSGDELRDTAKIRHEAQDVVRRFIHKRCGLRPLVLPTVIEV
jgi:ribonuclease J